MKASLEEAISAETSSICPQASVNAITTKILQNSDAPNPESDAMNGYYIYGDNKGQVHKN